MAFKLQKTADRPLQSSRVIVCEGRDEFEILGWIREQRGLGEGDVELLDAKGRSNLPILLGDLRFLSGGSDVQLVAVVLDAEEQGASDLALLRELPTIAQQHRFAYLQRVLPDPDSVGALETLVRRYANVGDAASFCANAWETCLAPTSTPWTTAQKDKAWSHVWLAGQKAFYSRFGVALTQNAEVREHMSGVVQHFETLLDEVLNTSLS
ncbi:DUF3226 domain-containing protein [Hydrogenophaga electricum]|uniref:ATP-dependent endonuclease n=1 Tax=Hydrogenophaga electricum TaxID=1230953 RepID=A0ABQ6C588_9BURK|nr:DUF3226 domain-containing protein [Hydrogenophaga electricum]GLS14159.1 hypothetical protein GCM10007935_15900 [Hydrogenophaga electricum]